MREHKYQLWDKKNKEMVEVTELRWNEGQLNEIDTTTYVWFKENFDKIALREYTNLRDKNGKKIYEEDVIKEVGCSPRPVVWEPFCGGYNIDKDIAENSEVIGNIYEHPHLLKEGVK